MAVLFRGTKVLFRGGKVLWHSDPCECCAPDYVCTNSCPEGWPAYITVTINGRNWSGLTGTYVYTQYDDELNTGSTYFCQYKYVLPSPVRCDSNEVATEVDTLYLQINKSFLVLFTGPFNGGTGTTGLGGTACNSSRNILSGASVSNMGGYGFLTCVLGPQATDAVIP